MSATGVYGLPYPELGEAPDVPGDIQALAAAVEATLQGDLTLGGDVTLAGDLQTGGTATIGGEQVDPLRGKLLVPLLAAITESAVIGTTETAIWTAPVTLRAGRAYKVESGRMFNPTTASAVALMRLRLTSSSGTDLGIMGQFFGAGASATFAGTGHAYILRTAGSDLPATLVVTLQCSGSVKQYAAATTPRYMLIRDVGRASEWPVAGVVV